MELPIRLKSKESMARLGASNPDASTKPAASPTTPEIPGDKFSPYDLATAPKIATGLPPEIWTIVQSAPANFHPDYFLEVSRNLLENPNLTASHLARAELSYQSFTDATYNPNATSPTDLASIVKHLRTECQPRLLDHPIEDFALEWTAVRKLIPRNPKLDAPMMQTCHLYTSTAPIAITTSDGTKHDVQANRYMLIMIPHASSPTSIPFYHPTVHSLAILYTHLPSPSPSALPSRGVLSIFFNPFPSHPIDTRLERTALMLLQIIHKHARGRSNGYKKRVHHDQVIDQKTFQDTYAYLKGKYAVALCEGWVEQTPAEKHVFEDLGIAAFLVGVWGEMYGGEEAGDGERMETAKKNFPGFVDIGCGNGLLVYILNAEGWKGWGFDARRRKTWDTFPESFNAEEKVREMLLIPAVLSPSPSPSTTPTTSTTNPPHHPGLFPPSTFIISNHADELTPWTPLLASLSNSPFIAIPCCSHDFSGARFRSPVHKQYLAEDPNATGKEKNKQPSAYAGLCSWVSHLTETMGYVVEKEYLRIPSTRNVAILGRVRTGKEEGRGEEGLEERLEVARKVVEREMGGATTTEQVRQRWLANGGELVKPGKGGH